MPQMPQVSLVVPAFNAEATLADTLRSLLAQSFQDFELIVVDDGSTDGTAVVARSFEDRRIRIITQKNRGLAGARNSGIHAARGDHVGFCDADDLWRADKLAAHMRHLTEFPEVGLSFSGSALIDGAGRPLGLAQRPPAGPVRPDQIFLRNPVGNGSAAVIRRLALRAIAWRPAQETTRDWWFDETFRQSEDIECWLRLALTTDWQIAGIRGDLTQYRINPNGLSAQADRQLASWERMVAKLTPLAPAFFAAHTAPARAYQLRYLARRAVSAGEGGQALRLIRQSLQQSRQPLVQEPAKTLTTLAAAIALRLAGPALLRRTRLGAAGTTHTDMEAAQ